MLIACLAGWRWYSGSAELKQAVVKVGSRAFLQEQSRGTCNHWIPTLAKWKFNRFNKAGSRLPKGI
jgi:hypothetical protein